ncbi:hypothetical protein [Falsirhodobacter halotolerans]|uniref:hypothetical protein n=1 Tax=Falsirhodobacter halotolerans TaxID=1146892 RepID=UPI001FD5B5D4|nr:hypothetical protein [Falsirhodobacter halotolerans]MCJ8138409.1 hypothetical protein [Falsirhodobacter halotolerans]
MTGPFLSPLSLHDARTALRQPYIRPDVEIEALAVLARSPNAIDQFILREHRGVPPGADMEQLLPDDPPNRLEPGGARGWLVIIAIAAMFFALIAVAGSLSIAPDATKHFLTFGGRIQ